MKLFRQRYHKYWRSHSDKHRKTEINRFKHRQTEMNKFKEFFFQNFLFGQRMILARKGGEAQHALERSEQ